MTQTFDEWIKWNWNTDDEDDPESKQQIEEEQYRQVEWIIQKFNKEPKWVEKISKETFHELPADKDSMWPILDSINDWLEENCSDEYLNYDPLRYIFVNTEDAMAFKLRWG